MRLKLDENIAVSVAPRLRALSFDVDTVVDEELGGRSDSDVWRAAQDDCAAIRVAVSRSIEGTGRPYPRDALPKAEYQSIMIRPSRADELETIAAIINDAAVAYRGIVPADCLHEPYMSREELEQQIAEGVVFFGYEIGGELVGVMGIQPVADVTLIRHAYVRTTRRKAGIGGELLAHLRPLTDRRILIGTWASASRAIAFYEKHGFRRVPDEQKDGLLRKYWIISDRQIATSVVLSDRV